MWVARQTSHSDWGMIRRIYGKRMPYAAPEAGARAAPPVPRVHPLQAASAPVLTDRRPFALGDVMKPAHSALALAAGIAMFALGAHAQTTAPAPSTQPPPYTAQEPPPPKLSNDEGSTLAHEDSRFLKNAIQGSHAEILGSQLALDKTKDADVRAFAQKMIDDHGKMVEEAGNLANKKGMTPPTGPSVIQSTEITALKALSGGAFDAMYVNRIGVASHESTVKMFEKAAHDAKDPDVKAMAAKTLPKLREHLEMARALNKKQDAQ